MKPAVYILIVALILASCADPSSITPPIVENPRPVEIILTPDYLDESSSEDRFSSGDQQEVPLTVASDMTSLWASTLDRSYLVLDTANNRLLRFRLSLVPRTEHIRDTMMVTVRRVVIELDSTAGIVLGSREYRFRNGEAVFFTRTIGPGERILYRAFPVDQRNPAVPSELLDDIYCKLQVWRTIQRQLIMRIAIQLHIWDEQGGQRKIRRLRASVLCQVPLP